MISCGTPENVDSSIVAESSEIRFFCLSSFATVCNVETFLLNLFAFFYDACNFLFNFCVCASNLSIPFLIFLGLLVMA